MTITRRSLFSILLAPIAAKITKTLNSVDFRIPLKMQPGGQYIGAVRIDFINVSKWGRITATVTPNRADFRMPF
jgi:hypothetical protein